MSTKAPEKVECNRPHCDRGDCPPCPDTHIEDDAPASAREALKRWHDEESGHEGPFRFCGVAPCRPVCQALEAVY